MLPDTPLIVMSYVPRGVLLVVDTVKVEVCGVALLNAVSEEKLHPGSLELVAPAGTVPNAQLSVTLPVNELPGVTAIAEVPLEPWTTERVVGEAVMEKPVVLEVLGACQKSPHPVRKQAKTGAAANNNRVQLPILIAAPFAPLSGHADFRNLLTGYRLGAGHVPLAHPARLCAQLPCLERRNPARIRLSNPVRQLTALAGGRLLRRVRASACT